MPRISHMIRKPSFQGILVVLFLLLPILSVAQTGLLEGRVTDAATGEPLPFTSITVDQAKGSTAGAEAYFSIALEPGYYTLHFHHLGYKPLQMDSVYLQAGDRHFLKVRMEAEAMILQDVVISAGRYAQRIANTTVSMQVLQAAQIQQNLSFDLEQSLEKLPGVDIIDGQANIRSGSGWSYGAGSRVLVLVDELPLLSPDASDAKWNLLPIENIEQVEVLKGASSALYGSAALNGVINIRTAWPAQKQETRMALMSGLYMEPKRKELIWDEGRLAAVSGIQFTHGRRWKHTDLLLSANAVDDPGYRKNNFERRIRLNTKLRYRPPKSPGLDYGLSASLMSLDLTDFLLWKDADSGAWVQNPETVTHNQGSRFYLDPFLNYFAPDGGKHQFRSRFFQTRNLFPDDPAKDNEAIQLYSEYQYQRQWKNLDMIAGMATTFTRSEAALFGNHRYRNLALFAQVDHTAGRLRTSLGGRYESFRLNEEQESRPVFRAGLNYQLFEYTFLRASVGQGFRFPSIAEKYTTTRVGGVNVFPNPYLEAEYGWNAEFGLRQGYRLGRVQGYLDAAAFYTEYRNMMEFSFGFYDTLTFLPTTEYLSLDNMGFQSQNIGSATIPGLDISLTGEISRKAVKAGYLLGYTYTHPQDQNTDSLYRSGKSCDSDMLKYRYRHSFSAAFNLQYRRWELGYSFLRHSFMECVDQVFVDPVLGNLILPGYGEYREENRGRAYQLADIRLAYAFEKNWKASIMLRNVANRENAGRPGDIQAPRMLMLRIEGRFHQAD